MKPTPSPYRWNLSDFATGYDAAAQIIHPRYLEIQDAILDHLQPVLDSRLPAPAPPRLVVDLGGGSGRLLERILDRWTLATGLLIDQSEPFLALAERRLQRFGPRATCVKAHLQDDWPILVPTLRVGTPPATVVRGSPDPPQHFRPVVRGSPDLPQHFRPVVRGSPDPAPHVNGSPDPAPNSPVTAFISMSAIHHLDPAEKETLYHRCYDFLAPGGVLLNGDEVRPETDDTYLAVLTNWANHMRQQMAHGNIPATFHENIHNWIDRNVTRFGQEKKSGDDCHETIATQLAYFRSAGFTTTDSPWQKEVWALLRAVK